MPKSPGNRFVGFVNVNGGDQQLAGVLPRLGKWHELRQRDRAARGGRCDHGRGFH
jgi:hypothetical protein